MVRYGKAMSAELAALSPKNTTNLIDIFIAITSKRCPVCPRGPVIVGLNRLSMGFCEIHHIASASTLAGHGGLPSKSISTTFV